mmetsp:Transcript_105437/g.251108  ORF Transcript_105437/g.251108 Transcript_105437/m.251108 type:complete len:201 (-) Transcript_105437:806-1408(-)
MTAMSRSWRCRRGRNLRTKLVLWNHSWNFASENMCRFCCSSSSEVKSAFSDSSQPLTSRSEPATCRRTLSTSSLTSVSLTLPEDSELVSSTCLGGDQLLAGSKRKTRTSPLPFMTTVSPPSLFLYGIVTDANEFGSKLLVASPNMSCPGAAFCIILAEVLMVSPKRRNLGSFWPITPAWISPVCTPILNLIFSDCSWRIS